MVNESYDHIGMADIQLSSLGNVIGQKLECMDTPSRVRTLSFLP